MFTRARNSIFGAIQPKNIHSLENLKFLYGVLQRNATVSDANRDLLTETFRSISEILIWGDQHDSSVFDYCFERGLLHYFLDYMRQRNGRYIYTQILQTLSILFENIRQRTSIYYLLSNNHINHIITHRFDFSDEEITAYYISFLKTLSLKLNTNSIHFFFSERDNDFPLYVEAIKFFNHPEAMVRIAVRTLTLNIYRVNDPAMHRFILDCTATAYFSNLVWFIRNHVLDFDGLIRDRRDISNRSHLASSLEQYLDNIHYVQDIFLLDVNSLNRVLKDQLMNRLLIPIYVFSLTKREKLDHVKDSRTTVDRLSALFLLAEFFLVITYRPVVEELADIILSADIETVEAIQHRYGEQTSYSLPPTSLDVCLSKNEPNDAEDIEISLNVVDISNEADCRRYEGEHARAVSMSSVPVQERTSESEEEPTSLFVSNWSDDEKSKRSKDPVRLVNDQLANRPYYQALIETLECQESDQLCFYALSVLVTMTNNSAVDSVILESVGLTVKSSDKSFYHTSLVDRLCDILQSAAVQESNIRIVTLILAITLLRKLVYNEEEKHSYLSDDHLSRIKKANEQATENLRCHFHQQELFLDMFEDEHRQTQLHPTKIEHLLKEPALLYPPVTTPLSGVEFINRLPSGETERARRSIRVFFLIRAFVLELDSMVDNELPLTKPEAIYKINDRLDLNNCDIIACTIHLTDKKDRRFLVIDQMQFILIEPDMTQAGWGIVKFCDLIQDVEVTNDKEDGRSLHITIHKPVYNIHVKISPPVLNAKFTFDDHIRCMTAKQNLIKGRLKARQAKRSQIASILELETVVPNSAQSRNVNLMSVPHQSAMAMANHPGRAALISGPTSSTRSQNPSNVSHSAHSNAIRALPSNVEHVRAYSASRLHPEPAMAVHPPSLVPLSGRRRMSTTDGSEIVDKDKILRRFYNGDEQAVNLANKRSVSKHRDQVAVGLSASHSLPVPNEKSEIDLDTSQDNAHRMVTTTED